jgi:hypothetical protein
MGFSQKPSTQERPFLPMSFCAADLLRNYVPFVDVTVPERVRQVETVFLRVFAQRLRFALSPVFGSDE